ncbi:hypothetical protein [Roseibium limicola]|uniref:Uncharacterized protein n=1 Tax=Roseibium limicola TaxID=2816037 RepID=A0A939EP15_9HYPH|nr:hypothetical protein [Roseibium limicola]MBO0345331.1 hypothetical protein [Roseibium limicola]
MSDIQSANSDPYNRTSHATLRSPASGNGYARFKKIPQIVGRTDIQEDDLENLVIYLQRVRVRAERIRDNAPAGSYLADVLSRTLDGLTGEISQLRHLMGLRDSLPLPASQPAVAQRRMRPAT